MGKIVKKVMKAERTALAKAVNAGVKKKGKKKAAKSGSSSGLLGTLGYGLGTYFGGPAGGLAGLSAGKLISKLTGFGDYKVSKNSISMGNSVPTFGSAGKGMRVMHREFLADIVGSVGFTNRTYSINPGLVASFPWISLLAADFEEFDMEGLVYEYRPSSGTAVSSTSSALGVVILATDYDAANPPFSSKQAMESYEYATSTVPFSGCIHPVECKRGLNVLSSQYVRTGAVPAGTDIRLYDMGNFQIATQGMQSAYVVGELWVSYDVVFRKPRLPPTLTLPSYARLCESPSGSATSGSPFGTGGAVLKSDSSLIIPITGGLFFLVTPGSYLINAMVSGSTTGVAPVISITPGANITAGPSILRGNTVASIITGSGTTNSSFSGAFVCNTAGSGAANQMQISVTNMANATVDLWITQGQRTLPLTMATEQMEVPWHVSSFQESKQERPFEWLSKLDANKLEWLKSRLLEANHAESETDGARTKNPSPKDSIAPVAQANPVITGRDEHDALDFDDPDEDFNSRISETLALCQKLKICGRHVCS